MKHIENKERNIRYKSTLSAITLNVNDARTICGWTVFLAIVAGTNEYPHTKKHNVGLLPHIIYEN